MPRARLKGFAGLVAAVVLASSAAAETGGVSPPGASQPAPAPAAALATPAPAPATPLPVTAAEPAPAAANDRVADFGAAFRDIWRRPAHAPEASGDHQPRADDAIGQLIEVKLRKKRQAASASGWKRARQLAERRKGRLARLAARRAAAASATAAAGRQAAQPAEAGQGAAVKPVEAAKAQAVPAKLLFGGARTAAAPLGARAIGFYSRGCLSGAEALAIDGPAWQVMRLSRNRMWGHPKLIAALERLARDSKEKDGWPGLLVGDLSQARGGPMLTGHASHQIGLDADIWFTPMPDRRLTEKERETLSATSMISGPTSINREVFTDEHVLLVRRAALDPEIERILVHPAIKKAMCEASSTDRGWLAKVRPYHGHHYHFHVRMGCPKDAPGCQPQPAVKGDDGCGKELDDWFKLLTTPPKPPPPGYKPPPPKPPLTLADLPAECRVVLNAGSGSGAEVRDQSELLRTSIEASRQMIDISGEKRSDAAAVEKQAADALGAASPAPEDTADAH